MAYDWGQALQTGAQYGALPGLIGGFFGDQYKNPFKGSNKYLEQIPGMLKPYFDPYVKAGQGALPGFQQQISQLMNDPSGMLAKFGGGYQQSPGYQNALAEALQASANQQAAGGMAGSPQAQGEAAGIAANMANKDYYDYLDRVLGLYGSGFQGQGGLAGIGLEAGKGLGEDLASILQSQSLLKYLSQTAENKRNAERSSGFMSGLGNIASSIMGMF